jgi:hypothetical protein
MGAPPRYSNRGHLKSMLSPKGSRRQCNQVKKCAACIKERPSYIQCMHKVEWGAATSGVERYGSKYDARKCRPKCRRCLEHTQHGRRPNLVGRRITMKNCKHKIKTTELRIYDEVFLTTVKTYLPEEDGVQAALDTGDARALRIALAMALGVNLIEAMKVRGRWVPGGSDLISTSADASFSTNTVNINLSNIRHDITISCPIDGCIITCTA